MRDLTKIIQTLKNENKFYIISHMLPDGDSIGSLLAMAEGLRSLGKEITAFTPGHIPNKYSFLHGSNFVKNSPELKDNDITVLVLDSSDLDRLGDFKDTVKASKNIINIDHHITNQNYGDLNLVNPDAAATGEIVYYLLKEIGAQITRQTAESLYVAISTDTGSFKYDNTTARTHRVIAELLETGISPAVLSLKVFDERPLSFYILLKEALSSLEVYEDRRIAVMSLSKDIRERCGSTTDDLEGIVNYTRNIEGVELGIMFYVEGEHEIKVGFRSRQLDVSLLAGKLNGGGHARAAGCRIYADFESVKNRVMLEAKNMIRELEL